MFYDLTAVALPPRHHHHPRQQHHHTAITTANTTTAGAISTTITTNTDTIALRQPLPLLSPPPLSTPTRPIQPPTKTVPGADEGERHRRDDILDALSQPQDERPLYRPVRRQQK